MLPPGPRIRPDFPEALTELVHQRQHLCDWSGLDALQHRIREAVRAGVKSISPFHFLALQSDPGEQLLCARQWARKLETLARPRSLTFQREPGRTIRLGYISADFGEHAMGYHLAELFELHDRARFETVAFSIGPDDHSPMRQRLSRAFDRFVEIKHLPHRPAAELIREHEVDILVDLMGYTKDGRPEILAFRPAPVQVNWLGFPGTMGASFIDYIIADPFIIPDGFEGFYSEKIVRLPDSYQPNDRKRAVAPPQPRAAYDLPDDAFVFCSFNQAYKITPELFSAWMDILRQVPGSVLWLVRDHVRVAENLRREAEARGVSPDRLVFAPRLPLSEHLARYCVAGLALDTFPYTSHATASNALWAGCPVVTRAGETFASRVAGSLLRAAGLAELVTTDLEAYKALAVRLASRPDELARLKERLAAGRDSSALFDTPRFTRQLEQAYERMWQIHASGQQPADIPSSALLSDQLTAS